MPREGRDDTSGIASLCVTAKTKKGAAKATSVLELPTERPSDCRLLGSGHTGEPAHTLCGGVCAPREKLAENIDARAFQTALSLLEFKVGIVYVVACRLVHSIYVERLFLASTSSSSSDDDILSRRMRSNPCV